MLYKCLRFPSSHSPKLDQFFQSPLEQSQFRFFFFYFIKEYFPNETIDSRRKETSRARIVRLSLKIFKTRDTKKKNRLSKRAQIIVERANVEKRHLPSKRNVVALDYSITTLLLGKSTKVVQFRAILAAVPGVNYVETLPHNTTRRSLHAVYAPWGQIMSGIGYIRKPLCLVTERGIERPV